MSGRSSSSSLSLLRAAGLAILAVAAACSVFGSSLGHFTEGGTGGQSQGCAAGLEKCDTVCVDTSSSPLHCGACDAACPDPEVCDDGACADSCSAGKEACDRACVDLQTDAMHCGSCTVQCSSAELCSSGTCTTSCDFGEVQCGSACVDIQTDDQHCGDCDSPCAIGQKCEKGACVVSCTAAQTECDGVCVDTQISVAHCGGCGQACSAGESCVGGQCKIACPGTQSECNGLCYDLQNNDQHCGACGNACLPTEVCGNGQCALDCPTGQQNCNGSCADLQTSSEHCGACGNACTANQECSAGQCVIACKTLLIQGMDDTWGYTWDGNERAEATWDAAKTACEGIGGRLPTPSELYRVSATQSATIGQTTHVNFLWSNITYSSTASIRVRLSDANTSQAADSTPPHYRCVCPPPLPSQYVGMNCYGPKGAGCFGLETEGKRYNLDAQDRAPLSKGAALRECLFYRGHLVKPRDLAEAILQGIGTGSGAWLHTAEQPHYSQDTILSWTDPATWVWQYIGTVNALSWGATTDFRPFRCTGLNFDGGTHPASVTNEWVPPQGGPKSETADTAAADWATANDTCWGLGGHLPTSTELGELITQGLPNGTDAWLWSSDQTGYVNPQFLVAVKKWKDTEPRATYVYPNDLTWDWKYLTKAFRCIYYPVDTSYAGPSAADCAGGGGCTELALPGGSGAKMWLDNFDRQPAVTVTAAIDACRDVGGHLTTERDLMEAIRQGLPNGSNAWLHTSDAEIGGQSTHLVGIVKWQGTDTAFTDQYSTYSTWGYPYEVKSFRCTWTNELR